MNDAAAGEGDDALRQQVEQVVVAPERGGAVVALPVGLHTTWWTPLRSVHCAAIFSMPGPAPCTSTRSAYLARALSRLRMTAPASATVLPPAMATRVPFGSCAWVSWSFRARTKSRASMAAEVSAPVRLRLRPVWSFRSVEAAMSSSVSSGS